ncbi:hypothetical protein [Plantibacter sp. RU18]|uniref:hypothetical protein n=1 Tax=Plantibacter sp. RU18 TaxID=3158143 RepID=UPI003D363A0B
MTTHPATNPTLFSLTALRTDDARSSSVARKRTSGSGRLAAFIGVLIGNIVLWSTMSIAVGLLLAVQLGLVGVVVAAMLR